MEPPQARRRGLEGDRTEMNAKRWARLMAAWGIGRNAQAYEALVAAYSAKGRFYHDRSHVEACLRHLETCRDGVRRLPEVELALWFHDAVYRPLSGGNEQKSADWAASFLMTNGADPEAVDRVHRLIMVTMHNAPTRSVDESMLVDIDLAILGAAPSRYEVFEQAVRKEYRMVPAVVYRKRRSAILSGFLDRPRIYQNEPFSTGFERHARLNLSLAISRLAGS